MAMLHLSYLNMSIYTLYVELARYVEFVSRLVECGEQKGMKMCGNGECLPAACGKNVSDQIQIGLIYDTAEEERSGLKEPESRQVILRHAVAQSVPCYLEKAACFRNVAGCLL